MWCDLTVKFLGTENHQSARAGPEPRARRSCIGGTAQILCYAYFFFIFFTFSLFCVQAMEQPSHFASIHKSLQKTSFALKTRLWRPFLLTLKFLPCIKSRCSNWKSNLWRKNLHFGASFDATSIWNWIHAYMSFLRCLFYANNRSIPQLLRQIL